ncbi:hypothetical protein BC828DRAFT_377352 [Blastocladiella britannica]|nr:hypothetical protein BC828DRAFT_377352 [Blastocladiella britannica]
MESVEYSWPELRSNLERLFLSLEPLPDLVTSLWSLFMWESPTASAIAASMYFTAATTGQVTTMAVVAIFLALAFHGTTQKRILAAIGLLCLYDDIQRQPAFADSSRTARLEHQGQSSLAQLADPETSPLYVRNVISSAVGSGRSKTKSSDELWGDLRDLVLAKAQLLTRDAADLVERINSMLKWRRPWATIVSVGAVGFLVLLVRHVPLRWLPRVTSTLVGIELFVFLPLSAKFPRYRRMFSLVQILLSPFPTEAEWAIETAAEAHRPTPLKTRDRSESTDTQPQLGPESSPVPGPATATVTRGRADIFNCSWRGFRGTLSIRQGAGHLVFNASPRVGASGPENVRIPMSSIVRIRKESSRHMLMFRNDKLVLDLQTGEHAVFEHVDRRNHAFALLASASAAPGREWRVLGT